MNLLYRLKPMKKWPRVYMAQGITATRETVRSAPDAFFEVCRTCRAMRVSGPQGAWFYCLGDGEGIRANAGDCLVGARTHKWRPVDRPVWAGGSWPNGIGGVHQFTILSGDP